MSAISSDSDRPVVSVIMANHQGGRYLGRAIASVLGQTLEALELIVVDDASTDESVAVLQDIAARDPRLKAVCLTTNSGPARARNTALELARGGWIAVVDADDIIHPERFERLLAAAAHIGADLIADDLMHFHDDLTPVHFLLSPRYREPFFVSAGDLVRSGAGRSPALGYLKPMIRAELLQGLRYDEQLRIGEDHDLLLRVLLRGAHFWVVPEPWYMYRRHGGSISHRLSTGEVVHMIDNQRHLIAAEGPAHPEVVGLLRRRLRRLERALAFEILVAHAKRGAFAAASGAVLRRPSLLGPLACSLYEHMRKRAASVPARERDGLPATIHLRDSSVGTAVADVGDGFAVPAYIAPGHSCWNPSANGEIWQRLGDLAAGRSLRVYCGGAGAVYAAGFIPADAIEVIEVDAKVPSAPVRRRPGAGTLPDGAAALAEPTAE